MKDLAPQPQNRDLPEWRKKILLQQEIALAQSELAASSQITALETRITQNGNQLLALDSVAPVGGQRPDRNYQFISALFSVSSGLLLGLTIGSVITYSGTVYELTDEGFGMTFGFPLVATLAGGFCGMLIHLGSQACVRRPEPIFASLFASNPLIVSASATEVTTPSH